MKYIEDILTLPNQAKMIKEQQNSAFKQLLKISLKLHSFELETSRELPNFAL